jgi:hypothetical protein
MQSLLYPIFLGLGLLATAKLRAADDILIADFEGTNYGNWKVTGEAFGPGPARGTLPGQMHVDGFKGKGLVNSFFQGDGTTGTLTSPAFTIQRNQLSFLIGGGDHKHETCIHLIIDGRILRTETGQNSEKLEPVCWDVPEYSGKQATLQIVDQCQGGWGHICVDQSVQTDKERGSFAQPDGQKPLGAQPEWEMGPFVKHATPVLSPTPDSKFQCPILGKDVRWEERNVYNPAAVVRDGKIYLLYRADDKNPRLKWGRTCRIGMAWSEDGIRFTRHPEPVLYPDNDQWKR